MQAVVRLGRHDNRELLGSPPGDGVASADSAADRQRHREKRHVTDVMPELVVDPREVVDVHHQESEHEPVPVEVVLARGEDRIEESAVRKPRQRVGEGVESRGFGGILRLDEARHIREDLDAADDLPVLRLDGSGPHVDRATRTVGVA
ncbi:MAG: hypothetical protein ABIR11_08255 [Candidatus Limnocylindrales bacterium]